MGTAATAIDPAERTVTLADGERLRWDRLLLAQGAEPRRLSVPGADLDGVLYLRDLADCDRLRATLRAGGRLVVIGAGWIGAEVAASARQAGLEVSLLERLAVPLEHVLGPTVGAIYADLHRERGVDLRAWRSRRSRGPAASSACACPTGRPSTARPSSSGSACSRARPSPRTRGSRWRTGSSWTPPRTSARRVRGR